MTSEYQLQAEKFLSDHGIKFSSRFIAFKPYFPGEKDYRNVYILYLTRDGKADYETGFGQSIIDSRSNTLPTAYDLLTCITKYDPASFDDFCGEYGYNNDSRKAEATYKSVKADWIKVQRFFTEQELEELQEIQ